MKKQLLMLAGSALILASCGSNNNQAQSDQAKLDSISKANAAMQDQLNQKRNDSMINAKAAAEADSIEKAKHSEAGGGEHHATHKVGNEGKKPAGQAPVSQAPAPPANPKDARFNTNPDGSAAKPDPNAPNKKADRFK